MRQSCPTPVYVWSMRGSAPHSISASKRQYAACFTLPLGGFLAWKFASLALSRRAINDRPVALGPPQQRAVLSLLALQVNLTVSADRLIEGLWEERAPASAAKWRALRLAAPKLLEGAGQEIVTHGRGDELRLATDGVDAARFEQLVPAAPDAGAPRRAARGARALARTAALQTSWTSRSLPRRHGAWRSST